MQFLETNLLRTTHEEECDEAFIKAGGGGGFHIRTGRSSGEVEKYSNMLAAWSASSRDMVVAERADRSAGEAEAGSVVGSDSMLLTANGVEDSPEAGGVGVSSHRACAGEATRVVCGDVCRRLVGRN